MVETKLAELSGKLKPLVVSWSPAAQEQGIDYCIDYFAANSWSEDEIQNLEKILEDEFKSTGKLTA